MRPVCCLKHRPSPFSSDWTWCILDSRRPCHCYYGFSQAKFKGVSRSRSRFKYRMYWLLLPSSPISTDCLSLSTANCALRNSVGTTCEASWRCIDPISSFIVLLGWVLGKPLTLLFDPFESIVLFLSGETLTCYRCNPNVGWYLFFWLVLTVNYVVQDGKSNWLEGMILMCTYGSSLSLLHGW